jgi:hypothetical protein
MPRVKSIDIPSFPGSTDQIFRLGDLVDRCTAPGRAEWKDIPVGAGIYVVSLLEGQTTIEFDQSAGDASSVLIDADYLYRKWHEIVKHTATDIIYIGKATSLRKRIRQLARFGAGLAVNHAGGEWMWQIEGIQNAQLTIKICPSGKEIAWEKKLLYDFYTEHGSWPIANRSGGQGWESWPPLP